MARTATLTIDPQQADLALLGRALEGDDGAWNALYQRYHREVSCAVARVLRRYLGVFTESDLADFTAEVWVALLAEDRRKLRCYDPARCRLRTWIKLLATNGTIDRLRVGVRGPSRAAQAETALELIADERPRADEQVAIREQAALARRALERLKANDRAFFVRFYLADAHGSTHDVARELGISVHTVHSRRFKIRQKLAKLVRQIERDDRLPRLSLSA